MLVIHIIIKSIFLCQETEILFISIIYKMEIKTIAYIILVLVVLSMVWILGKKIWSIYFGQPVQSIGQQQASQLKEKTAAQSKVDDNFRGDANIAFLQNQQIAMSNNKNKQVKVKPPQQIPNHHANINPNINPNYKGQPRDKNRKGKNPIYYMSNSGESICTDSLSDVSNGVSAYNNMNVPYFNNMDSDFSSTMGAYTAEEFIIPIHIQSRPTQSKVQISTASETSQDRVTYGDNVDKHPNVIFNMIYSQHQQHQQQQQQEHQQLHQQLHQQSYQEQHQEQHQSRPNQYSQPHSHSHSHSHSSNSIKSNDIPINNRTNFEETQTDLYDNQYTDAVDDDFEYYKSNEILQTSDQTVIQNSIPIDATPIENILENVFEQVGTIATEEIGPQTILDETVEIVLHAIPDKDYIEIVETSGELSGELLGKLLGKLSGEELGETLGEQNSIQILDQTDEPLSSNQLDAPFDELEEVVPISSNIVYSESTLVNLSYASVCVIAKKLGIELIHENENGKKVKKRKAELIKSITSLK